MPDNAVTLSFYLPFCSNSHAIDKCSFENAFAEEPSFITQC